MQRILFLMATLTLSLFVSSQISLINYGSSWKYHDKGSNLSTAWRATSYNDATWASGNAQLGYGDGDETTIVSYGSNTSRKYYTTYFRKLFTVSNLSAYSGLSLSIKRDDGAVVYINGTEKFRTNMPTGTISYTTPASSEAADDGNTPQTISLPSSVLTNGINVIAVEIHQRNRTSSDISFDLQLIATGDLNPPVVSTYSPVDNVSGVPINSNLVLTFNESVQKGSGNILIKEAGVTTQTIDVSSASVTVTGSTVTINPSDFGNNAAVNIEIAAGAFKDLANNNYPGINDATSWNFTIINLDLTPPIVSSFSPADNTTSISISNNLVLNFNESIQKGTGNIIIKEGGIITQTIDVLSANVSLSGNTVTINPSDFGLNSAVSIEITAGTFKDLANNEYAGITGVSIWNFTTEIPVSGPQTLINYGDSWKYLDNGTNQGSTWRSLSFNDISWASGNAQLGYGDGDETTVVSFGSNSSSKYITTYFRKLIAVTNPLAFSAITGAVKRDDGVVIYLNGTEIFRSNMPAGTISNTTLATAAASDDGNTAQDFSFSPSLLVSGSNVIAVEMHQNSGSSSDLSFDLQLTGSDADLSPPFINAYFPTDNATGISINSNLVLTFNESIQKGTGNIIIKEGGITTQTIDVLSANVSVSGNTVTINPSDFGLNAAVSIEITPGAFKDLANNQYAGITDASIWNFTTEAPVSGPQTFISYGDLWKYLDNGSNQGTGWRNLSFNDASWASGNAQLGYGDGDETTVLNYGPNSSSKYITSYFRKTINVSNPSSFSSILGAVKRDDGVVIYINGTEVFRNNMPAGTISNTTLASAAASDDGNTPQDFSFNPSLLQSGNNIISVEIHQNAGTSSDLSFDLQLNGSVSGSALLTRGPYMNSALQSAITIRWRTDIATDSKVSYGTSAGSLTQSVTDNINTTEHIVTLNGLSTNTLYYYSIGTTTQVLQGDANNYFKTMPAVGSTQKIRIMAMGDMGNNSSNQVNVRNAYQNFNGTNYTDAWILLGDNAYQNGTDAEFQTNFFNIYQGSLTKNHVLWPAPGNHDYAGSAARQADHQIPYYDMFTLPSAGQAGGMASGTEAYYSYNYGNVHFVSLDSYGWETGNTRLYDTLGPQVTWLKQDLAANTQPWTVVYFHHPPYSKGEHNSDSDAELINLRQRLVRILERYKVDMVLNGHSHSYERSYLINGHYGAESSFAPATHALSTSSAKYNGTANSCTYIKNGTEVLNGIVYAVVGSAGQLGGGTSAGYPHNAMYYSNVTNGGTLFFEVEGNRLDAKWICADGVIRDNFTIMKDVNKTINLSIPSGTPTQITASWIGNYSWSTGATTRSITVSPSANASYTVNDGLSCVSDIFNINILGNDRNIITDQPNEVLANSSLKVIPTLVHKGQQVLVRSDLTTSTEVTLIDAGGKVIQKFRFNQSLYISTERLQSGVYFIRMNNKSKPLIQKIVIID